MYSKTFRALGAHRRHPRGRKGRSALAPRYGRIALLVVALVLAVLGFSRVTAVDAHPRMAEALGAVSTASQPHGPVQLTPQQFQAMLANRTMRLSASYWYQQSLQDLTHAASIVVLGHVVGSGTTRVVAQPVVQPGPFIPSASPSLPPDKAQQIAQQQPPLPGQSLPPVRGATPDTDVPETTFTVVVTRTLRGDVKAGSKVAVTQIGGPISLPTYPGGPMMQRTVELEDNPLLKNGDVVVLFLTANADGNFRIVGGPQGRVEIVNGQVHSTYPSVPVLRDYQGETTDAFAQLVMAQP